MEFYHVSVLLKETVNAVLTNPHGIYVDARWAVRGMPMR